MHPFGELFHFSMFALTAILRCIGRVHQAQLPTSFYRFVGEELTKLIPTRVCNAFCKTRALNHFFDVEVFYADILVMIDDFFGLFVTKVLSLIANLLMDFRGSIAFSFGALSILFSAWQGFFELWLKPFAHY